MLINNNQLDIKEQYIGLEIGSSFWAQQIQRIEHSTYKQIAEKDLASHVFALFYENNIWYVWENHVQWKGIKKYTLSEYLRNYEKGKEAKRVLIYPHALNLPLMKYYATPYGNPTYSILDLCNVVSNKLIGLKMPDSAGQCCSESISMVDADMSITSRFKKSASIITPADIQKFFS